MFVTTIISRVLFRTIADLQHVLRRSLRGPAHGLLQHVLRLLLQRDLLEGVEHCRYRLGDSRLGQCKRQVKHLQCNVRSVHLTMF